jgi:SulP family sulfate permease
MQGLTAAVYGPLMGGLFGGSNYNILGPAGALVNILNKFSTDYGPEIIPLMAFYSGIMSMFVYLLGIEKYCMLIPLSVLEGFSFSVAVAIGFGQFNFALGLKGLPRQKLFH